MIMLIIAAALAWAAPEAPPPHPADSWFVARSQALLDAVGAGDKKVFADTLAPSAVMVDEEGKVRSAAELIDLISPLPSGLSGSIRIEHPTVGWTGDVAVLSYDAAETENIHGQQLNARYHTTDVYAPAGGEWRIVASQTSVLPAEAQPLGPPSVLAELAGTYRQGERELDISVQGTSLVMRRASTDAGETLRSLGGDYFAKAGRPREQWIFVRNPAGHVTGLANRRENNDLIWERISGMPGTSN